MSWRAGATLFWEIWPTVKANLPTEAERSKFTLDLLKLLFRHDVDSCDIERGDPEIDRLMQRLEDEPW